MMSSTKSEVHNASVTQPPEQDRATATGRVVLNVYRKFG